MFVGLVLIVIGLVFFAKALGFITVESISILWPILVLILGLTMITHHRFGHVCASKDCCGGTIYWGKSGAKRKK